MAINQNLGRNVQESLPLVGGGAVGIAGPAALREFADLQNGQPYSLIGDPTSTVGRLTRPSVAYGLGSGALTGLLYLGGLGPDALEDFYLAHTLTAIPAGAASAALPKEATGGGGTNGSTATAGRRQRAISERRPSSNGEFEPSGGRSQETSPAT